MTIYFGDFADAIGYLVRTFKREAAPVTNTRWQGVDVSTKPEMRMMELLDISLRVQVNNSTEVLSMEIDPNLPWADDHFEERVCGEPLNPGKTWRTWPWAHSADKFRDANGQFDHSYMERYWGKYAGKCGQKGKLEHLPPGQLSNRGARWAYGDLNDVVNQLANDPYTRQAYLPIFWPEDTGVSHGGRVPCSLGYHFIIRDSRLNCVYYLRSCDIVRHMRDDLYLTARLMIWVINKLSVRLNCEHLNLRPGFLTTHFTSLHCFANDWNEL